jgi:hypothetical protein
MCLGLGACTPVSSTVKSFDGGLSTHRRGVSRWSCLLEDTITSCSLVRLLGLLSGVAWREKGMGEDEMWVGFRGVSRPKGFVRPNLTQSRLIGTND